MSVREQLATALRERDYARESVASRDETIRDLYSTIGRLRDEARTIEQRATDAELERDELRDARTLLYLFTDSWPEDERIAYLADHGDAPLSLPVRPSDVRRARALLTKRDPPHE